MGLTAPIACRSVQVVTAICSWNRIASRGAAAQRLAGAIVRSGETYQVDPERPQVMIVFADARLPAGRWLDAQAKLPLQRLSSASAKHWRRLMFALSPASDLKSLLGSLYEDRGDGDADVPVSGSVTRSAAVIIVWQRVASTIRAYRDGIELPQAARDAGFPSMGHCTRAFRQLFGLSPATLLGMYHDGHSAAPTR
ncbi:hypothetical protein [Tahibacter aquaticus]|uniref:hypothetical protein n=1 Tax=Tahibacter aquaticus TaxID=520092 RepID=UPI001062250D|nr:hypothetical protein [Tahibacter aquaticus]